MPPRRPLSPWLALAASLLLATAATVVLTVMGRQRNQAQFANAVQGTEDRIHARLGLYAGVLRATASFFAGSQMVTREEFRRYAHDLDLRGQYPGIQGIGYAVWLTPAETSAVVRRARADGLSDFHIWPETPSGARTTILYLEPLDGRNRRAIGFDMFSEPTRRAAMERARDTGEPTLSGAVTLVQENGVGQQPGFNMYFPLYAGGTEPQTVAARRAALVGYVYSPFRARDLFAGIFGTEKSPRVRFRALDDTVAGATLLYDSDPDRPWPPPHAELTTREHVTIEGRPWTLEFASLPSLEAGLVRILAPAIALAGLLVSLVVFGLTLSQARARARAEESEAIRARFFAAMSHELRTPVNAILGYNDLLLTEVYGPLQGSQRTSVERSQRAARHLAELVNDVLDLSKLEAERMDLQLEEVRIPQLLDDLAGTIRPAAEHAGSALTVECEPGMRPVRTDPRRLRQILLNLLSNATKFGDGKPIVLRAEPRTGGGVVIEVRDHGPGIAPDDQRRIFEEFVQLPNAKAGGTGLGLPISRRLAELLGGKLEVESRPGVGSTFRVVLPERRGERVSV